LIFELSKPLSVSKDGFWNGGRKDDLANQHYFSQLLNDRLIDLYTKEKASKIIDFGCGLCHYVANLKKAGFNAFGYDGNPFTK
jgi:uroporphyrinogen-III decarboxylase